MRKITALRAKKGRGKRVNILLDGKLAFSLEADVAAKEGLRVEQTLSAGEIDALTKSDHFQRCLNAATHYLGYRPRSEAELRRKLGQRGFDRDTQEAVITRLKNQGLVDDMAFAQFWKENRESFNPRSRQLTRLELRQKGLDDGIVEQVVAAIDDDDSAYRVALNKARSLPHSDYQKFRRRLGEHLRRRGFSYGVINHTVERLWQGQTNSPR
ncbi:regulatory protein RecX [Chloroflexota bacterium]